MGLRDWFTSGKHRATSTEEKEASSAVEENDALAFAQLQATRTSEAAALFDEQEPEATPSVAIEAPYDASEALAEDLLLEGDHSFTHVDEVEITDVETLEDHLLDAHIEGDIPESVVFESDEKSGSV